jgi:DNA-binding NarL/FixJ family response regulator
MRPLNVVVAQLDAHNAQHLAASLYDHFRSVAVARSLEELRDMIPRNNADAAIVDLELVGMDDLAELHQANQETTLVCTHRCADEEMWAAALAAGASDMCSGRDPEDVVRCTLRTLGDEAAGRAA